MALRRWGPTPAAAYTGSAARFPHRAALIDERGTLTFEEVHLRTNALAREMRAAGIREGDGVAIMCRNHRGFVEATLACSKLGASALYLNTAFAGPQITDVMRRENPAALVYDADFANLVGDGGEGRKRFVAWAEPGERAGRSAARGPDRGRQHRRSDPARRAGPRRDPHLRHDRHAQGRRAQAARFGRAAGGAVLEDPAAGARDDDDRRADVPLVGLRALHARRCRCPRRSCCAGASTPRRRCARSPNTARARWRSCR